MGCGWRAKIGVMKPAAGASLEYEFYRMAPEGVAFNFTLLPLSKVSEDELVKMNEQVDNASKLLAQARVDVIVYACPSGSFVKGFGYDKEIIRRIEDITKIPATATTTAVVDALKEMEVRKMVIATPYIDSLNQLEAKLFNAAGFEVLRIKGLQMVDPNEIAKLGLDAPYQLARKVYEESPEADGVFISCGAWRTVEIVDPLERDLRKPVVSSSLATFWKALRMAGFHEMIKGYGRLLESL